MRKAWLYLLAPGAALLPSLTNAAEPTLAETLTWMDSTYNSHSAEGGAWGHGLLENGNDGRVYKRRRETMKADGCVMTLTMTDDPNASVFSEMVTDSTTRFNLKDIDPKAIQMFSYDSKHGGLDCHLNPQGMTCDMAEMDFETHNQSPLMTREMHSVFPKLKGKDHTSGGTSKTFVASFLFDDVEYAGRFQKAFRHAIALCGGKPSTF